MALVPKAFIFLYRGSCFPTTLITGMLFPTLSSFIFVTLLLPLLTFAIPPPLRATDPPIPPTPPPSPTRMTISNPPNISLGADAGTHCRPNDQSWAPDGLLMEHCTAALHRFRVTQVAPYSDQDYEFLAHDARPMYLPMRQVLVTPRKYNVGK